MQKNTHIYNANAKSRIRTGLHCNYKLNTSRPKSTSNPPFCPPRVVVPSQDPPKIYQQLPRHYFKNDARCCQAKPQLQIVRQNSGLCVFKVARNFRSLTATTKRIVDPEWHRLSTYVFHPTLEFQLHMLLQTSRACAQNRM